MSRYRTNVSINPVINERARQLMEERGFDDFSEFISALIREQWERTHPGEPATAHQLNETPGAATSPGPAPAPAPNPGSPTDTDRKTAVKLLKKVARAQAKKYPAAPSE